MRGFSAEGKWLGDKKGSLEVAEVLEMETILPLEAVDLNDTDRCMPETNCRCPPLNLTNLLALLTVSAARRGKLTCHGSIREQLVEP